MPDWTASMEQSFEYYIVDPDTWRDAERLLEVEDGGDITRDSSNATLGSASLTSVQDLTDKYVRTYLKITQQGVTERFALGTFMYQSPTLQNQGYRTTLAQDGYTPLIELKEKSPPYGYSIPKQANIMAMAGTLVKQNTRAPVVLASSDEELADYFISENDDTYLTFITDLIANAGYIFDIDPYGKIMFAPDSDVDAMSPVWEYADDSMSIIRPDIKITRDLYGVPNVVEVIVSRGNQYPFIGRAVNDDPNSIVSTVNRGREIIYRESDPSDMAIVSQLQADQYAESKLRELSAIEYTVTYTHGYCPVRVGDCVLITNASLGLDAVRAKVTRQVISLKRGCPVQETAVFTESVWG